MSAISGFINTIRNAVYGEQVRGAIISALEQCYSDVNAPSLQTAAFTAALNAAYAGGILDIQTVTQISAMTNQAIIYRYNGTQAGYQKGLYYYSALSNSWVLIGSEVHSVSLANQMTDTNSIYKYTGTQTGMVQNSLYCYNGTAWVPIGSGVLVASSASLMTNTGAIYKYTGSESGYVTNALYYYNGTAWVTVATQTDKTLTQTDVPADAKITGDEFGLISDVIRLTTTDIRQDADLLDNGSTISGTGNNIYYFTGDLPRKVHITGSSALGSNRAVVWIAKNGAMLSCPLKGTHESIDLWLDLPSDATAVYLCSPPTPTVFLEVKSANDIKSRNRLVEIDDTVEEMELAYYDVRSGAYMTTSGSYSNNSNANIWKYKNVPKRVHITGEAATDLSGSIATVWFVSDGEMVSAPISGSYAVLDKWLTVPDGIEEVWIYDGHGNNSLSAMTAVDLDSRKKVASLQEAVSGAVAIGSQWNGKNWFAYGTSITGSTKAKYAQYLAQMSGLLLNNKGIGGEGIGNLGAGSTGAVYDAICNTTDGKTAADLITLETGANDVNENVPLGTIYDTGTSTLAGCLNDCLRYLQANTNAQIAVTVSPALKTTPNATDKYYEWAEMVERICKINRVHFLNNDNNMGAAKLAASGKGSLYVIDPIHQTDLGGYIMAQNLWYQLRNIPLFYTSLPE